MGKQIAIAKAKALLPAADTMESLEGLLVDMVGKHKTDIRTMLDTDSAAVGPEDMQYFDRRYWGCVPTYARFMYELKKNVPDMEYRLGYIEAEELGGKYERRMERIASTATEDMDGNEAKRFVWNEKLYKIQERKMDRLDKRHGNDGVEKGVDLTLKIISALSNTELARAKEIIDAEYKEVGIDGE